MALNLFKSKQEIEKPAIQQILKNEKPIQEIEPKLEQQIVQVQPEKTLNERSMLDWWRHYADLSLEAKEETEWQLFTGLIDAQVCKAGLQEIGKVIAEKAGQKAEDKAAYMGKLKAVWGRKNKQLPSCPGSPDCTHVWIEGIEE